MDSRAKFADEAHIDLGKLWSHLCSNCLHSVVLLAERKCAVSAIVNAAGKQ